MPENPYQNSMRMDMVPIPTGTFSMGSGPTPLPLTSQDDATFAKKEQMGGWDEAPVHLVHITTDLHMAQCQVTNAQYEEFDPLHRNFRGKWGFSSKDDEAVVFISWYEATRFCIWLSEKEGRPYRLPTEAEWEYCCRAGTTTEFHTGDELPDVFANNAVRSWYPDTDQTKDESPVWLTVGKTPPNPWGLSDMHGNVEEWCRDWYAHYISEEQTDPVGSKDGEFRVTRGGSHSTSLYYCRSANRMGMLPEDRSWYIGFRVVEGVAAHSDWTPQPPLPQHQLRVSQVLVSTTAQNRTEPFFEGPRQYVKIGADSAGPLYPIHNHVPGLAALPNGDLLASWYSCVEEPGREVALGGSRLRAGAEEWEEASLFWDAPDRTEASNALWHDGKTTLYNFIGLSAAATWGNLVIAMRKSEDNGATWSKARIIVPEHTPRHMPIESIFRAQNGWIVMACDAVTAGEGGTALWCSPDDGVTWIDAGGTIAGIHAAVVELSDGRFMALGRGNAIEGKMPKSISEDMGRRWSYSASPFPPVTFGQRHVLLRLKEGPILLVSFVHEDSTVAVVGPSGDDISGLFAAISYDEAETWSICGAVAPDGSETACHSLDGKPCIISSVSGEPKGYMAITQDRAGLIHIISSIQHYSFNLAWLERFL